MKAIKIIAIALGLSVSVFTLATDKSAIQAELEAMLDSDQKHRAAIIAAIREHGNDHPSVKALWEKQIPIDKHNAARLEEIVSEYGWPRKTDMGEKAAKSAFLIVQHAPAETQKKYLPEMRKAAKEGEADLRNLAMLEDRVLVFDGKEQLYGTQVARSDSGAFNFLPIQDIEELDARREKMNLGPIAEYAERFGIPSPVKDK
ncbi:DUF6624 domain-containing protein [Microbulbifer sediminum]|uniref:DUF6624 domain-containing protein n=1 Tax=Microbulbifer sediminum TaxID=2904250 RepID=UPI001F380FAB|nr:DUF6624 domain-containing protein [Microbulbifer sediminum]